MKKCLILFTNYYPFYKGEEYLETELPIAKRYFDKILIIPTMLRSFMEKTRELPDGVEVFRVNADCSNLGKLKMIVKYVSAVYRNQNFRKNMKKQCGFSISKRVYYLYYQSRVASVTEKILKHDFSELRDYDSVTIYSYWMHAVASIALKFRRSVFKDKKVQLICRGHRYDIYENKNLLKYIPDRERILKNFTYIFPCSEDGKKHLNSYHPGFENKIMVRRLGTVHKGISSCQNSEPFLFISCSSVTRVKRLNLIIDMLCDLKTKGYSFKWFHFGDGKDMAKIKKYASEKLDSDDYEFKGHVSNDVLLQTYKESKPFVFLNTSSSEGVPVSIMEAYSFGIPVIATAVGGTAELVLNGVNGFLLRENFTTDEFTKRVLALIHMSSEHYTMLCKRCRKEWEKVSNAEKVYNDFFRFLEEEQ